MAKLIRRDGGLRDVSVDVARGIGIFLVMYGHGIETMFINRPDGLFEYFAFYQWRLVYSFHMPLFFMLSGLVAYQVGKKAPDEIFSRFLFLISLAIFAHLLGSIVDIVLGGINGSLDFISFLKKVVGPLLKGLNFHTFVVWFLVSIAIVNALYYLCARYGRHGLLVVGSLLAISSLMGWLSFPNLWQLRSWTPGFLFFALGVLLQKLPKRAAVFATPLLLLTILMAPLNYGCAFSFSDVCPEPELKGYFGVWMVSGYLGFLPMFIFTAVSGAVGIYFLGMLIGRNLVYLTVVLSWLGRCSLELLLINGFALEFINPVIRSLPYPGPVWATAEVLCEIAIQIAFVGILLRPLRSLEALIREASDRMARKFVPYVKEAISPV